MKRVLFVLIFVVGCGNIKEKESNIKALSAAEKAQFQEVVGSLEKVQNATDDTSTASKLSTKVLNSELKQELLDNCDFSYSVPDNLDSPEGFVQIIIGLEGDDCPVNYSYDLGLSALAPNEDTLSMGILFNTKYSVKEEHPEILPLEDVVAFDIQGDFRAFASRVAGGRVTIEGNIRGTVQSQKVGKIIVSGSADVDIRVLRGGMVGGGSVVHTLQFPNMTVELKQKYFVNARTIGSLYYLNGLQISKAEFERYYKVLGDHEGFLLGAVTDQ